MLGAAPFSRYPALAPTANMRVQAASMAAASPDPGITPPQTARTVGYGPSVSEPHASATSAAISNGAGDGDDGGDKRTGDGGSGSRNPGGVGCRGRGVDTR